MATTLDTSGIQRFLADLDAEMDAADKETAEDVAGLARQFVPKDSHDLEGSIHPRPDPDGEGWQVVAGSDEVPYAHAIEYGLDSSSHPTIQNSPAQPYMTPAAEAIDPAFRRRARLEKLAKRSSI